MRPKQFVFSDHFRTLLPSSAKHFLRASAQGSLEVATKVFLKIKVRQKLTFLRLIY